MTTRRDALLALSSLSTAACASAQQRGVSRRIGELSLEPRPLGAILPHKALEGEESFWERMKALGWSLGKNVFAERSYADWRTDRLDGLAAELVRKPVDVILCEGDDATLAAARATRRIPILFRGLFWPVEQGLVDSLARPGRNLTGFSDYSDSSMTHKRLELAKNILPTASRVFWIEGRDRWFADTLAGGRIEIQPVLEVPAAGLGFKMRFGLLPSPEIIDTVFEQVLAWPAQVLLVGGPQAYEARKRICELALRHKIALISVDRSFVEAGALLSIGWSPAEGRRHVSNYTDYLSRLLSGQSPAGLPVMQPTSFETAVNLRTAKALGLTIPQTVLQRAEFVVE